MENEETKKETKKEKRKKTIFTAIAGAVGVIVMCVVNHVLHKKDLKIATENGIEKGITATLLCGEYKSRTTGMPMIFTPDEEGHDTVMIMTEQVFNAHVNAAAMCKKED